MANRILVVAESLGIRQIIRTCLSPLGEVVGAVDNDEAMRAIETGRPNMMVVDTGGRTARDSGIFLVGSINGRDDEEDILTILLLPEGFKTDQCLCCHPLAPGISWCAVKPINTGELAMIANRILNP